jgi:ribose transport system permease protein
MRLLLAGPRATIVQNQPIVLSYLAALLLLVLMSAIIPGFGLRSGQGIRSLAVEASIIVLVSLGQTLVILTGGIDLSLPWTMAATAIIMTQIAAGNNRAMLWAIPLAIGFAALVGFGNGALVGFLRISPVVATLGMNAVLTGGISGTIQDLYGTVPSSLTESIRSPTLGLPNLVWICLGAVFVLSVVMSSTSYGRRLYAFGSSRTVALYSGIRGTQSTLLIYAVAAMLNGAAGILVAAKAGSASLGMGDPYLFISAAAVALGGASLLGGSGHVIGTVAGALLLTIVSSVIPVMNLPGGFNLVMFGVVIVVAMTLSGTELGRFQIFRTARGQLNRRSTLSERRGGMSNDS